MIPSEKEEKMFAMSNFLPSNLLNEEEHTSSSNDMSLDEKCNFILEEKEDQNGQEDIDLNDNIGPMILNPKTHYSDSNIINAFRSNVPPMNNISYLHNGNFYPSNIPPQQHQAYCNMPLFNSNQRYISFLNNMNVMHPQPQPQPYHFNNQMFMQQNQIAQSKLSQKFANQLNMSFGMGSSMNYQSNDTTRGFANNSSLLDLEDSSQMSQKGYQMRKYNSSGNIKNEFILNNNITTPNQSKNNKTGSKRKKSSLFLNKAENKAECDIRDFKRFCDGLKCELDQYICSQIGSRIMQKYLSKFPSDIITLMIKKLNNHIPKIMVDVYGNYFCQKLINLASNEQRVLILQSIETSFCNVAKENSGTHVLQTLLDLNNLKDEERIILRCIEGHELEMAYDVNATHVLQKIISAIDESKRSHLNQIILDNIKELSLNSKGICVVKKFICASSSNEIIHKIIESISKDFLEIAESPYGNYAIQNIIEEWTIEKSDPIIQLIINHSMTLSIQKYSTNIIEKILPKLSTEKKEKLIIELFNPNRFHTLISNKISKYVLMKLIKIMNQEEREAVQKELIDNIKDTSGKGKKKAMIINDIFIGRDSHDK